MHREGHRDIEKKQLDMMSVEWKRILVTRVMREARQGNEPRASAASDS